MKKTLNENKYFIYPYLFFCLSGIILLILFSKSEIHIAINSFHNRYLDIFFKYCTSLGDGYFAFILCLLLIFVKYRWAIITAISCFASGMFVQILKKFVFVNIVRPVKFFKDSYDLYLVEGVKIHKSFSFPSGHATTAFCVFLLIALISKNNIIKLICFIVAFLVAYSRMYLSQHFFIDVYIGSIIGVLFAFIIYLWLIKWNSKAIDSSLIKSFKK